MKNSNSPQLTFSSLIYDLIGLSETEKEEIKKQNSNEQINASRSSFDVAVESVFSNQRPPIKIKGRTEPTGILTIQLAEQVKIELVIAMLCFAIPCYSFRFGLI